MDEKPDGLIRQPLREVREDMATKADLDALRAELASHAQFKALRVAIESDLESRRAELSSGLLTVRTELPGQIADLAQFVIGCHAMFLDRQDFLAARFATRGALRQAQPHALSRTRSAAAAFLTNPI